MCTAHVCSTSSNHGTVCPYFAFCGWNTSTSDYFPDTRRLELHLVKLEPLVRVLECHTRGQGASDTSIRPFSFHAGLGWDGWLRYSYPGNTCERFKLFHQVELINGMCINNGTELAILSKWDLIILLSMS